MRVNLFRIFLSLSPVAPQKLCTPSFRGKLVQEAAAEMASPPVCLPSGPQLLRASSVVQDEAV